MTPKQALSILDQVTQPGFKPMRQDFINIQIALEVLAKLVETTELVHKE